MRDDAKVVRVLARDNEEVDDGWLCDKGRFGYQSFGSPERITTPLVRDGGFLREISLGARAVGGRRRARDARASARPRCVGGQATNEEGFLVQHLLREGLGSPHVDVGGARGCADAPRHARALARPDLSAPGLRHRPRRRDPRARHRARRRGADPRPARAQGGAPQRRAARGGLEPPVHARRQRRRRPALRARRRRGRPLGRAGRRARLPPRRRLVARRAGGPGGRRRPGFRPGATARERAPAPRAPADAVRAAADVLRDAGDVVVIWGERVARRRARRRRRSRRCSRWPARSASTDKPESGLIEIPAETNGRGLREVGLRCPALGAGPARTPTRPRAIRDAARGALLLLRGRRRPRPTLRARPRAVIAFAAFRDRGARRARRRGLPGRDLRREGGHDHAPGRSPPARAPGARPCRARCAPAGGCSTSCASGSARAPARCQRADGHRAGRRRPCPSTPGLTLDEIGGQGVRWQDRDAASGAAERRACRASRSTAAAGRAGGPARSAPRRRSGRARRSSTRPRCASSPPARRAELSVDGRARGSASTAATRCELRRTATRSAPSSSCAPACRPAASSSSRLPLARGPGGDRAPGRRSAG